MRRVGLLLALSLCACGDGRKASAEQEQPRPNAEAQKVADVSSGPAFGKSQSELAAAEAAKKAAGLGTFWVKDQRTAEYSSPGGAVVNHTYRGTQYTVYERRGSWSRVVEDGSLARWVKTTALTAKEPPPLPEYRGPTKYQDPRIREFAIPKPGQYGLTKADVDILWKGAKLVLETRGCAEITNADKSMRKKNTYYVTCNGSENIFFTKAEALAR